MDPNNGKLFSKKNIIYLALFLIIAITIPLGVLFVRNQQPTQLKSQAATGNEIKFTGSGIHCDSRGDNCTSTNQSIEIELTSPF